ncbi:MAG: LEPR-XLL domain-containing protein [Sedimentisphaerales bacterium]|nr:LEPR-XLL domain-containing protein [Sedimentisphaerales bacterium]
MLRRFEYTKGWKISSSTESKTHRPPLLERLEPRILLSGDGLLSAVVPDPFLDTMPQLAQHAKLLETIEQVEQ